MKRRDFLARAAAAGAVAVTSACPPLAPLTAQPATRAPISPVGETRFTALAAPLGPPPLCTVPRGWSRMDPAIADDLDALRLEVAREAAAPWDWGMLDAQAAMAAQVLGRLPRSWREVAEAWESMFSPELRRGSDGRRRMPRTADGMAALIEQAGVRLDDPLPPAEELLELGRVCRHWRNGTGPFADGAEHHLPLEVRAWEHFPSEVRDLLRSVYDEAGAPWGRTDTGAALYIWHVGETPGQQWDGDRFVSARGAA